MAEAQGPFLAAVLFLVSLLLHCSSSLPACPESCTCQRAPLWNCSSSGLSLAPQPIQDSVTELDLSHNRLDSLTLDRPHYNLKNVWLGNNSITRLSLCIERNLGSHYVRGRHLHRLRPWGKRGCVSWAPTLHLLSIEQNQLEQLPEGLEGSESLQVLHLSFNKISTLQREDFSHLRELKELHLQHNLITNLHPQMFQNLDQLRVLDLSFNMLTSLHPLMYLSLRNIGVDVRLGGNRWQCDCSMRSLKRRMAYDSSRGLQAWSVVCASPSILSGKDLIQLEEDDLNCFSTKNWPELHQDVTVYSGSEMLLSCSTQDSIWSTFSGQASVSQPQAGLLLSDITERDTGLYVCVSEDHKVVSVFNLQISKIGGAKRKTRSLPRTSQQIIPQGYPNRIVQERNQGASQSNLALAVCLSVFITFLVAFILGVLARPCIDVLWRRVTKKKISSGTNSVSFVEQRQYDNEAYSNSEEPEEIGNHRERRVTFSTVDFRKDTNVQYYDTIASGDQESINNDAVIECEAAKTKRDMHTTGDSSQNSLQQTSSDENQKDGRDLSGITDAGRTHNIEFEHIPDPVELEKRRSLSSCSGSSVSDKVFIEDQMTQGDYTTPKSPQLAEDSVQQKADFSTESRNEIPGYSFEPFANWSPHTNNTNLKDSDLWQESEEQFEFSDSVRSTSARSSSVFGSFNDSKLIVAPSSDKQRRDDMSSSSSYVSGDEPTQYTVNSDQEEGEDIQRNQNKPEVTNQFVNHDAMKPQMSASDLAHVTPIKRRLDIRTPSPPTDSSSSGESADETMDYMQSQKQKEMHLTWLQFHKSQTISETQWPALDLKHTMCIKRRLDIKAPPPSSSSESEDEITGYIEKQRPGKLDIAGRPFQESQTVSHDPDTKLPALDIEHIPRIRKRLDIKAPCPPPDSSSRSDSEDETSSHTQKQKSISTKVLQFPQKVEIAGLLFQESQARSHDPETQWPALDLGHIPRIKRHLDIKTPSPPPDSSSSSDCEDETTGHIEKQRMVDIAGLPLQQSQTASHDPGTRWPALDLEHIPCIKRRLDIRAPSPPSDSFSSSDCEDETTGHIEKQRMVDIAGLPLQQSQTKSHDPDTRWPALDLEHIPCIKRRLDIKTPSPPPDSSSSSDCEDETTGYIEKQRPGMVDIAGLPLQQSQTASHDPGTRWPALDLEHIPCIKRRLDIRAPSPPSDSFSNSEIVKEKIVQIQKHDQGEVHVPRHPFQESQAGCHDPKTQWPALDLEHTLRIKRRLDIKTPSPPPDSSSSSDCEDETTGHIEKQRPGMVDIAGLPLQQSQTASHDPGTRWPALDLEHTLRIKRHLDIKVPLPSSDSSSSSDSEDESSGNKENWRPGKVPFKKSHTESYDPDTRWPALDLKHIPRIKRRLDIKAPSPPPNLSFDSEIVEEKIVQMKKHEQERVHILRLPFQESQVESHDPETQWPTLDLEHTTRIKRRLDIKASSPDLSSSSESEDETIYHTKESPWVMQIAGLPFQESQTVSHDPETKWPAIDLGNITRVKKRLDLKAPTPSPGSLLNGGSTNYTVKGKRVEAINSSSSSDNQEGGMEDLKAIMENLGTTAELDPGLRWPELDLSNSPHVKRRLDIKARSFPPSEDGTTDTPLNVERNRADVGITSHQPETKLPDLKMSVSPIKRRLNIKAPYQTADSSSFNSDNESRQLSHSETSVKHQRDKGDTGITNHEQQTKLYKLSLGVPYINRRLDIKAPSPQPDPVLSSVSPGSRQSESNSFRNDSEDENRDHTELGLGVSVISKATEKDMFPKTSVINISHSPKTDHNVKLNKYTLITDDMGDKITSENISTIPEINPELEARWTTMNLGISRFRKRLEITSRTHDPPNQLSSPPSDQNHNSLYVAQDISIKLNQSQSQTDVVEPRRQTKVGEESDSLRPHLSLTNIPHIKRALDIRAPLQRKASSSSNSENETIDDSVLDLSLGVPQVKRCLNVKAPLPELINSSSSCSESENEVTNMSGMTDNNTLITYKRLIMKPLPPPSHSSSLSGQSFVQSPSHCVGDRNAYFVQQRVPNKSFNDVVKKKIEQSRPTTDVDLPPETRWTGVGRQLSDFSFSSPRRPHSFNSSSGKSDDKIKQDRENASVALMQYSSLSANSVSLASSRPHDRFDNRPSITNELLKAVSEDRMERKGLSALKVMSSERQKWDTEDEDLHKGTSPLFDDHGSQGDTSFIYRRSEEDIKPLAKQPLTQIRLSSTSMDERRASNLLNGIPRYRRHDFRDIKPLQEAPPPIPETPPPLYEAVGLTWSPQSSKKEVLEDTRSYLQQSRNTETDPSFLTSQNLAAYFDTSNMNSSDV